MEPEPLPHWWARTAKQDLDAFLPKLAEYGSRDLEQLGQTIRQLANQPNTDPATATELGIHVYLAGKLARATEAYAQDRHPSADTLHDITIYSMMARANRERGNLR